MTNLISTTKSSTTKLDTALESPTASELLVDGPKATLESRINTRRAELNQKLTELSASMHLDGTCK